MKEKSRITKLLVEVQDGDKEAHNALFEAVYNRLRNIARIQLVSERKGHTLSKTELVHEAYIKLVDLSNVEWQDRAHFYAIAAKAMRQILVDYARKRNAEKRGGKRQRVTLQEDMLDLEQHAEDLIALNDLIDKMAEFDKRKSKVVEMRFFAGMTIREIAKLLDVSTRTIDRDWLKARTWLYKELKKI